jgi:phosphatidylserine decarboxylase
MVLHRDTGVLEKELQEFAVRSSLPLAYRTRIGRVMAQRMSGRVLARMSEEMGQLYNTPESTTRISAFIEFFHIDVTEFAEDVGAFATFNEFFYRRLHERARPIVCPEDAEVCVSPADSRLLVFPTLQAAAHLWIKGHSFSLSTLLMDQALETEFGGCGLALCRLAPQDYHRFHSPLACTVLHVREIEGRYFSVNPVAVRGELNVFTENKRVVVTCESEEFGKFLYIAVGATMVGSVILTCQEGSVLEKGDEIGYFAFGGSTILVLFKEGTMSFDEDLLHNSNKPIETLVKMGTSMGRKVTY